MMNRSMYEVAKHRRRRLRKNQTDAETVFWEQVRKRRFMGLRFLRQHSIFYNKERGTSFFIPDFYCHALQLIVEIDGPIHQDTQEYDMQRTAILNSMGYHVIRFTNDKILNDLPHTMDRLKRDVLVLMHSNPGHAKQCSEDSGT